MYLKIITAGVLLLIVGCTERNTEYYEKNIDEAQVRANECEASMKAAFMSKDKEALESIAKDAECNSAITVTKKHKKKLAQIKQELKQKELAKIKKEEENKFKEEYSKKYDLLQKLSYEDFYKLNENCKFSFGAKATPECKAYNELKKKKKNEEIDKLKTQYVGGELEKFRDKSCQGLDFNNAYCEISTKAASQQKKEMINYYLSHRDELKKNFNICHHQFITLKKEKKWKEAKKSTRTYRCSMVSKAASKLKVYNFNKAIG